MADDKNIEMVVVDEHNSSKEGSSVENAVAKSGPDASTQKGVLDVHLAHDKD
jgi:hypothetical protein